MKELKLVLGKENDDLQTFPSVMGEEKANDKIPTEQEEIAPKASEFNKKPVKEAPKKPKEEIQITQAAKEESVKPAGLNPRPKREPEPEVKKEPVERVEKVEKLELPKEEPKKEEEEKGVFSKPMMFKKKD
eukprot:TRINITY_DN22103_c0_g1_i2.p1 TRINITY_DN22103_c0_g1~~TRINITY_DN22103_c0_g1_i2.p1  ORF type:complete len:131 (-),score=51.73 TRINITY_DN22103_c0_g1_i2:16-408(-)